MTPQDAVADTAPAQAGQGGAGQQGGAVQLIPVDDETISEAVRYINERTILNGLQLAKEVGEYIVNTFFGGDYTKFADPSRSKSLSFRALLARKDLLLGKSTLYVFVRISEQLKLLPAEVATQLPLAHHRALLPLPDSKRKEALARRAVREEWPSRVLGKEVRKLLPKSRQGRRPLPSFAKAIRGVAKALDLASETDVTADAVAVLGPEQRSVLAAQVEESLARLEALKEALEGALEPPTQA